jgi:NADPH:quinone reductase-like Zn-dependent oxidoreductase
MRAIITTGQDTLRLIEVAIPEPAEGQLRIKVAAAGVNPADISLRKGFFHRLGRINQPDHTGLGWDIAGTVDSVGPGVAGPATGTPVAALQDNVDVPLGGYAEFVVVPASAVAVLPAGLDPIAAATVPLNALTAAQVLDLLDPANGRRLLITGAAGAVGGFAVPLASRAGWQVTALARSTDRQFVHGAGAGALVTDLREVPPASFDAVIDAAILADPVLATIRDGGRYAGVAPSAIPVGNRDISTTAVRVIHDGPRLAELLQLVAAGTLVPRVAGTLPLADAAQAQANVEKGAQRGRWVLLP